jgi:hypothetical protein
MFKKRHQKNDTEKRHKKNGTKVWDLEEFQELSHRREMEEVREASCDICLPTSKGDKDVGLGKIFESLS